MEEKEKESWFVKLHGNTVYKIVFFCVTMAVMIGAYAGLSKGIQIKNDRKFNIVQDNFTWVFQVEDISETDGKLVLDGWAFHLEEDATEGSFEIVLRDIETKKRYYPEMKYHTREDVNEYFLCEFDYTQSGFTAEINAKKLDLETGDYEVILHSAGSAKAFATNIYYSNGEMMFVNPKEYVPLQTEGTDLEKITEDGVLRVYRPDFGMYVYQYEGALYWIAEPTYGFVNEDTYVQFLMDTTQIDKLPEDRLANESYKSKISFWFKSRELTERNTGQYRVTKCVLPEEYSVTQIRTGNYSSGWIWKQDFRPWFDFAE